MRSRRGRTRRLGPPRQNSTQRAGHVRNASVKVAAATRSGPVPVEAALDGVAHGGRHCQPGPRAGARARWQCAATAPPRPGASCQGQCQTNGPWASSCPLASACIVCSCRLNIATTPVKMVQTANRDKYGTGNVTASLRVTVQRRRRPKKKEAIERRRRLKRA